MSFRAPTRNPVSSTNDLPSTIDDLQSSSQVLASTTSLPEPQMYFTVNVPARFLQGITAPNLLYSLTGGTGVRVNNTDPQHPVLSNTGLLSLNSLTGSLELTSGDGISLTTDTTNNKINIKNTGILSLSAGDNISIDGNKISNTYSAPAVDFAQSGWTDNGTSITLSTTTDTVTMNSVTAGAITANSLTTSGLALAGGLTVTSGNSILPDTDLGSDLGSSAKRFNNLWVANINSNSSQSFSGQTTFSYPPTSTAISQASVLINPTTASPSGQLLGLGLAGYERALIDAEGDITLGYNSAISAPSSDYPLNIYGHNGTRMSFTDTSGNAYFAGNMGVGTTGPSFPLHIAVSGVDKWFANANYFGGYNQSPRLRDTSFSTTVPSLVLQATDLTTGINAPSAGNINFIISGSEQVRINNSGNVGIGTTDPSTSKLQLVSSSTSNYELLSLGLGSAGSHGGTGFYQYYTAYNNYGLQIGQSSSYAGASSKWLTLNQYNGNVGIGTTNPGASLDITRSDNQKILSLSRSSIGGLDLSVANGQWVGGGNVIAKGQSGTTAFGLVDPSDNVRLFVNLSSGNVGIGTTSPGAKLDVAGIIRASQGIQSNYTETNTAGPESSIGQFIGASGYWAIRQDTSHGFNIDMYNGGTHATAFTAIQNGNVGIGTTNPVNTLQIGANGGGFSNNDFVASNANGGIALNTTSTNSFVFSNKRLDLYGNGTFGLSVNTGNVGIGTTSPGGIFEVTDGTTAQFQILANYSNPLYRRKGGNYLAYFTYSGVDDANLGLYSGGIIKNYFASNGVSYLNGGNVGIGTTAPGTKLNVFSTGGVSAIIGGGVNNGGNNGVLLGFNEGTNSYRWNKVGIFYKRDAASGSGEGELHFAINNVADTSNASLANSVMMIDRTGNVGIGTTAPSYKLHVSGDGQQITMVQNTNAVNPSYVRLLTSTTSTNTTYAIGSFGGTGGTPFITGVDTGLGYTISHNSVKYLTILSGGNVGIGTTAPAYKLDVLGVGTTGIIARFRSDNSSGCTIADGGTISCSSDRTLKKNIDTLNYGLSDLLKLNPVTFNWNFDGDGKTKSLGFIAQDVESIIPGLVSTDPTGLKSLNTIGLVPVLAKAIQEQQLQLDGLSNTVLATTSSTIDNLPSTISFIQSALDSLRAMIYDLSTKFVTKESHQEKLCVGTAEKETCVTQEQLELMLKNMISPTVSPSLTPTVTSTVTPEITTPEATNSGEVASESGAVL